MSAVSNPELDDFSVDKGVAGDDLLTFRGRRLSTASLSSEDWELELMEGEKGEVSLA